ncbi:hypothetical protein AB0H18_11405 [Streptomyces sp. NPDC020766]|uniref:hypothetical protein n=1 Tax=Streptomyces sp. NPDC020766 TaxID=3155011 RepID=UPI0033F2E6DD
MPAPGRAPASDTGSATPAPSGARGTARPAQGDLHKTTAGSSRAPEGTPVPGNPPVTQTKSPPGTPGTAGGTRTGGRLMSPDVGDKWSLQLQHAVAGFIDGPRGSVEEADKVLQEVAARFTDAVTERRRTLRTSWQTTGEDKADTEQLRLALRDYRELAERLLRL